jgi:hypothetical protein
LGKICPKRLSGLGRNPKQQGHDNNQRQSDCEQYGFLDFGQVFKHLLPFHLSMWYHGDKFRGYGVSKKYLIIGILGRGQGAEGVELGAKGREHRA